MLDMRRYCAWCGAEIPDSKRADTMFCNRACAMAEYQSLQSAAILEAKRNRPPCRNCGGPVPAERNARAVYCSMTCQRQYCMAQWRRQFARVCEHCRNPYVPVQRSQRFCCNHCYAQAVVRKHKPRPCAWCGTMISNPKRAARKYCGSACAARAREAARRG